MTGGHEPGCARPAGHLAHYECGGPLHSPGDPCEFCGAATPADGGPCLRCWAPLTIAAFKAVFAHATLMDFAG